MAESHPPFARGRNRWTRWCLRADPRPLLLIALLGMCATFWEYRLPQTAMHALGYVEIFVLSGVFLAMLATARRLQLGLRAFYERRLNDADKSYRSKRRFWSWLLLMAAATTVGLWTRLPLGAGFLVSRATLNQIADEALAQPERLKQQTPRWAGVYEIARIEVIGTTVVVYIGDDPFGFARVPTAASNIVFNREGIPPDERRCKDFPIRQGFESCEGDRIFADWFVVYTWYGWNKIGWS